MQRKCFILLLACALASCTESTGPLKWISYTAPGRDFAISLPQGYDTTTSNYETEFGTLPVHYVSWSSLHHAIKLVNEIAIRNMEVNYFDLPVGIQQQDLQSILKTSMAYYVNGMRNKLPGFLKSPHDTTISGYPAICFVAERDAGKTETRVYYVRKVVAHNRLYTQQLITYKSKAENKQIDTFFNSFRILD